MRTHLSRQEPTVNRLKRLLIPAALIAAPLLLAAAPEVAPDTRMIPLPEVASDVGEPIDGVFRMILWITGVAFVLVEGLLLYIIFKYRAQPGRKVWYSHGNNTLEVIWTVIPALILIFIGVKSQFLWTHIRLGVNGEPKIEVMAQQFQWTMRYAGPDGKLGRSDARFVSDENTWGLDPSDAHGVDDRVAVGVIVLRKGEYARIRIRSKDVLHSFFVPVFRFKQDAVPGMPVDMWVRPTLANVKYSGGVQYLPGADGKERKWQIACAELCGNSHTNMKGLVYVVESEDEYQAALAENAVALWESTPPVVPAASFFAGAKLDDAPVAPKAPPPVFTAGGPAGTLSGAIEFMGEAPAPRKVSMSGDPFCSGANPGQTGEELVVNGGKLANVFVYLEGVEGKPVPAAPAEPVIFDQQGCWYKPHVFGIRVGQTLEIRNSDATMHNVHGMGEGDLGFNDAMSKGAPAMKKTFSAPAHGVKVKCDVHGWMGAYAHVMEHPWFAVSGTDGKFSIPNVPPGDYTLVAWHEALGTQKIAVTVTAAAGGDAVFTFAKK